jgi:hypothetical protein
MNLYQCELANKSQKLVWAESAEEAFDVYVVSLAPFIAWDDWQVELSGRLVRVTPAMTSQDAGTVKWDYTATVYKKIGSGAESVACYTREEENVSK